MFVRNVICEKLKERRKAGVVEMMRPTHLMYDLYWARKGTMNMVDRMKEERDDENSEL